MTKKITTYEDMVEERERPQLLLKAQKDLVRADLQDIKLQLTPVTAAVNLVGKVFKRDKSNPLLNVGVNTAIDLILKKVVLARFGWFTRFIVPFIAKNVSSQVVNNNIDKIKAGIFSIFASKNGRQRRRKQAGDMQQPGAGDTQ